MRALIRSGLLACALAAPCAHAGELQERAVIRDAVTHAWRTGDYDTMDRLHTQYSDFLHQRTASGAWKMGLLMDGLTEDDDATAATYQHDIARTERWAQGHPDSSFGPVMHAQALLAYAFFVRGGGYSGAVGEDAWRVFHDYNQRAAKVLTDHREVASRTTSWHATMINIGRNEGWTPMAMRRVFDEGVARDPTDYRLYQYFSVARLPKWGGGVSTFDAFVRRVSEQAPPAYGMELYARLYSGAEQEQFSRTLYRDTLVDWPMMKSGLQAWVAHFPTSWNRNIFAYHACLEGDRATTQSLLAQIGTQREPEIWRADDGDLLQACRRWAADPAAGTASPIAPPRAKAG